MGNVTPIFYKTTRYGKYASKIIKYLCNKFCHNYMVEDNRVPWVSIIWMAYKAKRENIPWKFFIWILCMLYQKFNQITRFHSFLYPMCADTILHIVKAMFQISVNLDSGYWKIPLNVNSQPKISLYRNNENLIWTGIYIGAVNASTLFALIMD